MESGINARLLCSTLLLGGACVTPAHAQLAAATTAPAPEAAKAGDSDVIIVTGSLFKRNNAETPSPVSVLTSDTLAKQGITNISDAVRSVSADGAGSISTGFQNGFSAGGSAVSLRGLGVSSTLVLIDGLRTANYPLNDDGHNAYVDLNSIPFSIVDRVEVLKDGASSTYGADAIGGVVNIIMKKHFNGLAGQLEGGASARGDATRYRGNFTAGFGDYAASGWNFYVNGEYQRDGAVSVQDRQFPFNTLDLSSIGGLNNNTTSTSLSISSVNAVVRRTTQTDPNNPLSGGTAATTTGLYRSLNLNCPNGTFTVAGAAGGTACIHDNTKEFAQIQPRQQRYSFTGRLSFRLSDDIEGYVTGSYAHNEVRVLGIPRNIRSTQPFGASPGLASSNPGIALPVYVCAAGVNCATAVDARLNPNNPFAATGGSARIYYLFGDIPFTSDKNDEVIRGSVGFSGSFGDSWNWRVEAVGAKSNLKLDQNGYLNIAGLLNAINTGSYNFVNPALNTAAVRAQISPTVSTPSNSSLAALDVSLSKKLLELPGGPLQVLVGGQVRRETLINRNQNFALGTYGLSTSSAQGKQTVSAGFFEVDAPLLTQLEINASGRYDNYSEGFSRFSPKVGAKFTPIKQVAFRGTYSQGFRAPTFAENGPQSSYAGFSTITPPASFQAVHGGVGTADAYALSYSLGTALTGNPNLKPEKSQSFTGGVILEPVPWLTFTADYYHIRKTDVIVAGPLAGDARTAYFAGTPLPAGYTVNTVDAPDPLFPNALPRVLIINAPFTNGARVVTSGIDLAATARIPIKSGVTFTSRIEVTDILQYDFTPGAGAPVQKYVGTLGPYELSSGAGTPRLRGNWTNTIEAGPYALTATAFYVSRIKEVAADEGPTNNLSCLDNLYSTGANKTGNNFCYIHSYIDVDLNAAVNVAENFSFYLNVGNVLDVKAPIAPASYSGTNYLPTWHYSGIIGRSLRAGATFKF